MARIQIQGPVDIHTKIKRGPLNSYREEPSKKQLETSIIFNGNIYTVRTLPNRKNN